jgi:WD40 repeat protein
MRFFITTLLIVLFISTPHIATGQDNNTPRSITADDATNLRVLTLLAHHTAPITEMSFSPDNTAFLTGSLDGTLCIWNVAARRQTAGELRLCLAGYTAGITLHTWSPDDELLAVTLDDGLQIALYNITEVIPADEWGEIEPVIEFPANEAPYLNLAFVADGERLFTHDLLDTFTLFDLEAEILFSGEGAESTLNVASTRLAMMDFEANVQLINAESGEKTATLETDEATHAIFSPGGRWLVTWGGAEIEIWDTSARPNQRPRTLDAQPDNVQFSPDGRFLATWEGQDIRLWNVDTGEVTGVLPEHRGGVRLLAFGADSTRAISINAQGVGRYWELSETGVPRLRWWFDGEIDNVLVGPDFQTLITLRQDIEARFWDFGRGQVRGRYNLSNNPLFSPDWTLVAINRGNLVAWHGLDDDPRIFEWMPLAFTPAVINIRPTPSQEMQRIGTLPINTPIFAIERTADSGWIRIQLPDDTTGWIQASALADEIDVESLPVPVE